MLHRAVLNRISLTRCVVSVMAIKVEAPHAYFSIPGCCIDVNIVVSSILVPFGILR